MAIQPYNNFTMQLMQPVNFLRLAAFFLVRPAFFPTFAFHENHRHHRGHFLAFFH